MLEFVAAAQNAGLTGIAFTDHVEWMPEDEAYNYLQLDAFFAELEAVRAQVNGAFTLLAGVEIGNPHNYPAEAAALLAAAPWDYVIGSAHWHGGKPGWRPIAFAQGMEASYQSYFEELTQLAAHGDFDVVGHFDIVRRDSVMLFKQTLDLTDFADPIRAVLRSLIARGKGLEINTSGPSYGLPGPLPDLNVLRWYRELGGEILVFGSDAHKPEHVGRHFAVARELALTAGFTHLARFAQRQVVEWIPL